MVLRVAKPGCRWYIAAMSGRQSLRLMIQVRHRQHNHNQLRVAAPAFAVAVPRKFSPHPWYAQRCMSQPALAPNKPRRAGPLPQVGIQRPSRPLFLGPVPSSVLPRRALRVLAAPLARSRAAKLNAGQSFG